MGKVLFYGPYPNPITGQSLAFKEAYRSYSYEKVIFDSTKYEDHKYFNTLYSIFFLPIVFITNKIDKVYFTCSRSKLGFLKDLQLLVLCKFFNVKIINHLHGADFKLFYNSITGFFKKMVNWSYSYIDLFIVLLPSMKKEFSDFPKTKIKIISNSFSRDYLDLEIDLRDKKKQICYLSNLIYSKGIVFFMDAIDSILSKDEEVTVKIAGKPMGDDYMSLKDISDVFFEKSKNLKIKYAERYQYLGVVSGESKKELLLESSFFVLPTFYKTEAFPISIIEAMRFGNVILTTNHNYLPDVVTTDNGEVINVKSSKSIDEKINLLLSDKKRVLEIQKFNIKESIDKYSPLEFSEMINQEITHA